MKRFILLCMVLFLLLASLLTGIRVYAQSRAESAPDLLDGFATCQGVPCFLGIRPGVTTWEDAQKGILAHYPNAVIGDGYMSIEYGSRGISIEEDSNKVVAQISVDLKNAQLPLAAVIAKLGPPCAVSMFMFSCPSGICYMEYMDLHYDSALVGLAIYSFASNSEAERLWFNFPIDQLSLSPEFDQPTMTATCKEYRANPDASYTPWLGFASVRRRYLAYAEARSRSRRP